MSKLVQCASQRMDDKMQVDGLVWRVLPVLWCVVIAW